MKSQNKHFQLRDQSNGLWMLPPNFKIRTRTVIGDSKRQKKVLTIYESMVKLLRDYDKTLKNMVDINCKIEDNKRLQKTDYYKLLDDLLKERLTLEAKLLSTKMDLVNNINRDEWIEIFAPVDEYDDT